MVQTERLDRQFAKYQLVQRIADGRMGEVFKAKSEGVEGFEKILCVKILYPRLAREEKFVETVIDEAKRSVSLSHANVAQVLELGQDDDSGRYFIATEHINGPDLGRARRLAERAGREWPRDLSLFIASEVAKALDYAHRRKDFNFDNLNLLHRDVSPNNILVSYDGEVKVTDFGLSRAFDTVPASREDDPDRRYLYAPPEHARGAEYNRSSDIFSLGLVTYEMLTGSHPYVDDGKQMRQSAADADIPPIGDVLAIPADLEQILNSMLEPDPAARLDNAGTAYEQLVEFLFEQNLRSDNRALSKLMTELRQVDLEDEEDSRGEDPSLDQISHADVESFYEQSEVELSADSSPSDALPDLPGGLEESFERAQSGRGRAVLMSGQFGLGRRYLPDRLADVLSRQRDTQSIVLHRSEDDRLRPWGLIADLMETLADETADAGIESPVDSTTLSLIDSLGGSEAAVRLLAEIWGLRRYDGYDRLLRPEQSIDDQVEDLLQRWMRRIDQDQETLVIVVDRIERADRRSLRLVRQMLDWIGSHSVLLVMSTKTEEAMRQQFDVGEPDALRAVRVGASEVTDRGDIPEFDDVTARILLTLSLLDRPVRRTAVAQITGEQQATVDDAADTLADHGLVRTPHSKSLLSAVTDAEFPLKRRFPDEQLQRLQRDILRYLEECSPDAAAGTLSAIAPIRLRLSALSRDRRNLIEHAARYEEWLSRFGWEPIAADLYDRLSQTLTTFPVGDPRIQLEALARSTHYSLQSGSLTKARQTLEPLAARATQPSFNALAELLRGRIFLFEDDLEQARRALTHAAHLAGRYRAVDLRPRAALALARLARRYGDRRTAHDRVREAEHAARSTRQASLAKGLDEQRLFSSRRPHQPLTPGWRALLLDETARLQLESGQTRAAHKTAKELAELAEHYPAPSVRLRSDLVDGLLFAQSDRARTANHRFDRVVRRAHDLGVEALALDALRCQTDLAFETQQYEHLADRAENLRTSAQSAGAIHLEQLAEEYAAFADVSLDRNIDEALQTLRKSVARARHRGIPRDLIRTHSHLAEALEEAPDGSRSDIEHHRQQARRINRRWRLE